MHNYDLIAQSQEQERRMLDRLRAQHERERQMQEALEKFAACETERELQEREQSLPAIAGAGREQPLVAKSGRTDAKPARSVGVNSLDNLQ